MRLARKGRGKEARLHHAGHVLAENRNGLMVEAELTAACGTAEREAGLSGLQPVARREVCWRSRPSPKLKLPPLPNP